jgi:hypothetical protein
MELIYVTEEEYISITYRDWQVYFAFFIEKPFVVDNDILKHLQENEQNYFFSIDMNKPLYYCHAQRLKHGHEHYVVMCYQK